MQQKPRRIYDVIVVGGGPAGMMAAATAASRGKSVVLIEKNKGVGKKLLITGGGRCNVTKNRPQVREMLSQYKGNDKFLFSAFAQMDVVKSLQFFHDRGMPTKEENDGRMFPVSNSAQSVWDVLVSYMKEGNVEVRANSAAKGITKEEETGLLVVALRDTSMVYGHACILATGGTSRPETGSEGDGFAYAKSLGHTVRQHDFGLVPISLSNSWTKKLSGVALTDIKLTAYQDDMKQESQKGRMLFTHFGVSGPAVLNLSRTVGDLLRYGKVELRLDLFPKLDNGALRKELQALLVGESNKKLKNTLPLMLPKALALGLLEVAEIDGETFNHSVRTEDRAKLVALMKAVPLHVKGILGANKAVISSGGVVPEEVDFRTMESRKVPGLFVVGDMLDIDRPSGGYSLQLCWTTGFVAGTHA